MSAEAHWWEPDPVVLDAVMDGRLAFRDLDLDSQSWVVAELSERGLTTLLISEKLKCSQRQVKRVRARTLTQQMRLVARLTGERDVALFRVRESSRYVEAVRRELDFLRGGARHHLR